MAIISCSLTWKFALFHTSGFNCCVNRNRIVLEHLTLAWPCLSLGIALSASWFPVLPKARKVGEGQVYEALI